MMAMILWQAAPCSLIVAGPGLGLTQHFLPIEGGGHRLPFCLAGLLTV
jgi:hypothetical protein